MADRIAGSASSQLDFRAGHPAYTRPPQLGLAGSVILTGMLIVPWIVSASRTAEWRYGNVPRTPQTGRADQDVLT